MATAITVIRRCDRCAFKDPKPVTQRRVFAIEDRYYEIDLCDPHADMFDRDLNAWTMLAAEVDNPYQGKTPAVVSQKRSNTSLTDFNMTALENARRLKEIREREEAKLRMKAAEDAQIRAERARMTETRARKSIPGSMKWKIALHAYQRLVERGFSVYDVLETAAQPEQTYLQPWRGDYVAIYQRAHCRVVVNEDSHTIITVIDRDADLEKDPRELAASLMERKAQ